MIQGIPDRVLILIGVALFWPAVRLLWSSLTLIVCWRETHPVFAFRPDDGDAPLPETPFSAETNRMAGKMALDHCGTYRHSKGGSYRVRYDAWAATDREFLVMVGSGSILGLPCNGIVARSVLDDGRFLLSFDNFIGSQLAVDGLADGACLYHADIAELVDFHLDRIEESGAEAVPFDEDDPVADWADAKAELDGRLVESGMARFVDDEGNAWRRTLRGACRYLSSSKRLARRSMPGMVRRSSIRRPGHPVYVPSWSRLDRYQATHTGPLIPEPDED